MVDVHGKITLKLSISLGWKRLKFKLGLEVWENECSSDSDVDEVSLMNRKAVTSPLVQSVVAFTKSFKLGLE